MKRGRYFLDNRAERGIYLVLAAIASMVVVTAFVVLALENVVAYRVSFELRRQLDTVCKSALELRQDDRRLPGLSIWDTARIFWREIPKIQVKNAIKTSVTLFTPPQAERLGDPPSIPGSIPAPGCPNNEETGAPLDCQHKYIIPGGIPTEAFPFRPQTFIPGGSAISTAGSAIGCMVTMKLTNQISRFLNFFRPRSNERTVKAYTAYDIPVRSVYFDNGAFSAWASNSPGLTIAIAPEMQTSTWRDQFRFGSFSGADVYATHDHYQKHQSDGVDPLRIGATAQPIGFSRLNWTGAGSMTPYLDPLAPAAVNADGFITNFGPLFPYSKGVDVGLPPANWQTAAAYPYPRTDAAAMAVPNVPPVGRARFQTFTTLDRDTRNAYSDREEMLAACMNPAILMRNLAMSTLIELAARHGGLRFNTEVLYVNPLGFGRTTLNQLPSAPPIPNNHFRYGRAPIVELVPLGRDLVQRQADYELPFVWFEAGDRYDTAPGGNPVYWINPFGTSAAGSTMGMNHFLVANQLRFCHHLYYNPVAASPNLCPVGVDPPACGIATDGGANRAGLLRGRLWNMFLNTGAPRSGAWLPATYSNPGYRFNIWDTAEPKAWSPRPRDADTGAQALDAAPSLTPAELVSMIGSVQSCPVEQRGLINPLAAAGGPGFPSLGLQSPAIDDTALSPTCVKPTVESNAVAGSRPLETELRPDYLALFDYLNGTTNLLVPWNDNKFYKAGIPRAAGVASQAYTVPGYDIHGNDLQHIWARFPAWATPGGVNNSANALVIFTHRPPMDPAVDGGFERDSIQAAVRLFQGIDMTNAAIAAAPREYFRYYRPITVIYMPTNAYDASPAMADLMNQTFDAPTDADNRPTGNTIITLNPNLRIYEDWLAANPLSYGPGRSPDATNHQLYFRAAIMPTSTTDPYKDIMAVDAAKKIFYELVLKAPQPRFWPHFADSG